MNMGDILHALIEASGYSEPEIRGPSKSVSYIEARSVGYTLSLDAGYSSTEAAVFWRRTHATVLRGAEKYRKSPTMTFVGLLNCVRSMAERRSERRRFGQMLVGHPARPAMCLSAAAATTREWSDWLSRPSSIHTEVNDEGQPNRQDERGERPGLQLARGRQPGGSVENQAHAPTAGAA